MPLAVLLLALIALPLLLQACCFALQQQNPLRLAVWSERLPNLSLELCTSRGGPLTGNP